MSVVPSVNLGTLAQFSNIVAFGDSYSDNGNGTFKLTNGTRPASPPYWNGRWSNGPVWTDFLASFTGAILTDFARGGGIANVSDIPADQQKGDLVLDLDSQFASYQQWNGNISAATSLYTVFIAGNDFIDNLVEKDVPGVASIVNSTLHFVNSLISEAHAQNIMVFNLPDATKSPYLAGPLAASGESADIPIIESLIQGYNSALKAGIAAVSATNPGVKFYVGDLYSYINGIFADAATLNLTVTNSSCYVPPQNASLGSPDGTLCSNPDDYLFFDPLHPTSRVHRFWALYAASLLPQVNATSTVNATGTANASGTTTAPSSNTASSTSQVTSATATQSKSLVSGVLNALQPNIVTTAMFACGVSFVMLFFFA